MPDFYALTAPKLFALIQRILKDESSSSKILSDVYQYIWTKRNEFSRTPMMIDFLTIAQRFALDHKLAGKPIARANSAAKPLQPKRLTKPTENELNLLKQIYVPADTNGQISHKTLNADTLHERMRALMPNGQRS